MTRYERIPLAGVVGWPIAHTRSPALHGYWLRKYGVSGRYVPLGIEPRNLEAAFSALPLLGFRGVNVTIPFKESALRLATKLSDRASLIGAANMVTFHEDGSSYADNTDGFGFIENLKAGAPGWRAAKGPALILGAGGAARAVIHALLGDGAPEIRIANRTKSRAEFLADSFGAKVKVVDWVHASAAADGAATIVNTTSLGMTGQPALGFSLAAAPKSAVVNDIVYNPVETELIRAARGRKLVAVDGLGMLLHQGRPGFENWFGVAPEVDDALREAVLAEMDAAT